MNMRLPCLISQVALQLPLLEPFHLPFSETPLAAAAAYAFHVIFAPLIFLRQRPPASTAGATPLPAGLEAVRHRDPLVEDKALSSPLRPRRFDTVQVREYTPLEVIDGHVWGERP